MRKQYSSSKEFVTRKREAIKCVRDILPDAGKDGSSATAITPKMVKSPGRSVALDAIFAFKISMTNIRFASSKECFSFTTKFSTFNAKAFKHYHKYRLPAKTLIMYTVAAAYSCTAPA